MEYGIGVYIDRDKKKSKQKLLYEGFSYSSPSEQAYQGVQNTKQVAPGQLLYDPGIDYGNEQGVGVRLSTYGSKSYQAKEAIASYGIDLAKEAVNTVKRTVNPIILSEGNQKHLEELKKQYDKKVKDKSLQYGLPGYNEGQYNAQLENLREEINSMEASINRAKTENYYAGQMKKRDEYEKGLNSSDAAGYIAKGKQQEQPLMIGSASPENIIYYLANEDYQKKADLMPNIGARDNPYRKLKFLTEEEKNTLFYYAGKGEYDKVQEYYHILERDLNARQQQKISADTQEFANKHKVLGTLSNVAASFGTPAAFAETFWQNWENNVTGEYVPVDHNSEAFRAAHQVSDTAAGITQNMSGLGAFLTETGLSIAQFASKLPLGPAASLAVMSSGAAGQTAMEAIQRGATTDQALQLGTVAGIVEVLTEKLPIDNLFKLVKAGKTPGREMLRSIFKQAGIEGTEELVSEYANIFADIGIMGENSEFQNYVNSLMESGVSQKEAESRAMREMFINRPAQAFAGGALSGLVTGSGAEGMNYIRNGGVQTSAGNRSSMLQGYTLEEAGQIEGEHRTYNNIVARSRQTVVDFWNKWKAQKGSAKIEKLYLGKTTPEADARISEILGYEASGRDFIIASSDIQHIYKKHGDAQAEAARGQIPITEDVIAKLPSIIANPDSIQPGDIEGGKQGIVFTKDLGDGRAAYIQFDNSGRKTLQGKTLYVQKNKGGTRSAPDAANAAPSITSTQSVTTEPLAPNMRSDKPALHAADNAALNITSTQSVTTGPLSPHSNNIPQNQNFATEIPQSMNAQHAGRPTEAELGMDFHTQARYITGIAKKLGVEVAFSTDIPVSGLYSDGKIVINPHSKSPVFDVFKHELTHYIESSNNYLDFANQVLDSDIFYNDLQNRVQTLQEYANEIQTMYRQKNIQLDELGVQREMVARFVEEHLFYDEQSIRRLAQENRNVFDRIRNWISDILVKFRGTEQEYALRKMEQLYEKAARNAEQGGESADKNASFRIEEGSNGEKYVVVDVDQDLFDKAPRSEYSKIAKRVIRDRFANAWLPIGEEGDGARVYKKTPREYAYPRTKVAGDALKAKMRASTELDNLLAASEYQYSAPDDGRHGFAKDGWDYYKTKFVVGGKVFEGLINVGNADSIATFYDITKIKGPYELSSPQTFFSEENTAASGGNISPNGEINPALIRPYEDSIPQGESGVNYDITKTREVPNISGNRASETIRPTFENLSFDTTIPQRESSVNTEYAPSEKKDTSYRVEEGDREIWREDPVTISRMTEQKANTTPPIKGTTAVGGDSDSRFYNNLQSQNVFDEQFKSEATRREEIKTYSSIANEETMKAALKNLDENGQRVNNDFLSLDPKKASAEDIATGFILMKRYQDIGDYSSMANIAGKLREMGTASGQTVQMFSILGRMTPEGMTYYAQKSLSEAFEKMVKGKSKAWIEKNQHNFRLTGKEVDFIQRRILQASQLPEGRAKNILLAEIATMLQNKIPKSVGDKARTLQRISLLLNPKTNIRNITGNALIAPVHILDDFIGSGIDKLAAKATNVRTTGMFDIHSLQGMKKGLYESFDDFRRDVNTRNMEGNRFDLGEGNAFSNTSRLGKAINALDHVTSFLLDAGDRPFYEMWFLNSLNNQLRLNKVDAPTAEMIDVATQDALNRTWQDNNAYTRTVRGFKDVLNKIRIPKTNYGLGDVYIKFVKTPANLTKAMVDYSPAGLVKAIASDAVRFRNAVQTGKATPQLQRNFVKSLSSGITGTMMYILFAGLANAGILTGKGDDDKDVSAFERNVLGIQPYSIKIGDMTFSYEWAQPIAGSAAIMADIVNNLKDGKMNQYFGGDTGAAKTANMILSAIQSGGSVLYNQSFMQSIQNFFKEDNMVMAMLDGLLDEPSAFVPQALNQTAQLFDNKKRASYEYGSPVTSAINQVTSKIPGVREHLEPTVDVLGREVTSDNNWFNVFFNPANVNNAKSTEVSNEMYRLYKATGDKAVIPPVAPWYYYANGQKTVFSAQQKTTMQKTMGETSSKAVECILKNKHYNKFNDSEKAEIIKSIYSYASAYSKSQVTGYELKDLNKKVFDATEKGINPGMYLIVRKMADKDESGNVTQEEMREVLNNTNLTREQKAFMWQQQNKTWKKASNPFEQTNSMYDTLQEIYNKSRSGIGAK